MTTPTTSRVSDELVEAAKLGWLNECARHGPENTSFDQRIRAALEAALASQGDVVAVSELPDAMRLTGMAGLDDYWRGWNACLSAILNRGGK